MDRGYTRAEELAHWLSASLGAACSIAAIPWLIVTGMRHGGAFRAAAGGVFAACALLMFTTSALYHAASPGPAKARLRTLDHAAIFLLIAGTYTPFTIAALHDTRGWALFGVVWLLAAIGVVAKVTGRLRSTALSSLLYVGLGWIGLVNIPQIYANLSGAQFAWLLAGGLAYTSGVLFYIWKSQRFTHAIWHGFVTGGVACHFVAVLGLMARAPG
jgi:hemolysin III